MLGEVIAINYGGVFRPVQVLLEQNRDIIALYFLYNI